MLEGEEVDILKEESGIDDKPDYILHFRQPCSGCNSKKEQYKHQQLIKQFECDNRSDEAWFSPPEHVAYIRELKRIVEGIETARQVFDFCPPTAWQTPPPTSAPADYPCQPVLLARKKTKKESQPDGKTTFKATLENMPDIDDPEKMTLEEIAPAGVKALERAVFNGTFRAMARFNPPDGETPVELIHRLRCDNVEWNYIVRELYKEENGKDIDEDLLPAEVKRYQKQHRTAYPEFYAK